MNWVWGIGITVLVLTVLLVAPVTAELIYQNTLTVRLRYLFLRFTVYPQKPAKKDKPKKAKPAKAQKEKQEPAPKKTVDELLAQADTIKQTATQATGALKFILRHFKVYLLRLHITVAAQDAAQTAIRYGQLNGIVYGLYAGFSQMLRIKKTDITLTPNFTTNTEALSAYLRVGLAPWVPLAAVLRFGVGFIKQLLQTKNKEAI